MFFEISKIGFALVMPSNLCLILIGVGVSLLALGRYRRAALRLTVTGFLALVVLGYGPVGVVMLSPLEERFAPPVPAPSPADRLASIGAIDGIILLGGFEDGRISRTRGQVATFDAGERLIETARLGHLIEGVPIIFSGGVGGLVNSYEPAGDAVVAFLRDIGLPDTRLFHEGQSRNTFENAVETRALIETLALVERRETGSGASVPGRWLLITTSWHMPRSVGTFRKAGFEVVAWPVDFRTAGEADASRLGNGIHEGLERVDLAAKEWIGLLAYWLTGRSESVFPSP
ncbi:MAG: YdcF family protein [Hyphomicrobiaceae bacterium]